MCRVTQTPVIVGKIQILKPKPLVCLVRTPHSLFHDRFPTSCLGQVAGTGLQLCTATEANWVLLYLF